MRESGKEGYIYIYIFRPRLQGYEGQEPPRLAAVGGVDLGPLGVAPPLGPGVAVDGLHGQKHIIYTI